jgi:hypothetical protein
MLRIFSFVRMNPPTKGHGRVMERLRAESQFTGVKARVYLSFSHDHERNPLAPDEKLAFVQASWPDIEVRLAKNVFAACQEMGAEGATEAIMVVGEDRADDFRKRLTAYFGTEALGLESVDVQVVSRDAEDASATKARHAALSGDWQAFQELSPSTDTNLTRSLYEAVRIGLGVT